MASSVFELPKTVDVPNSVTMDETRTGEKLGIVKLSHDTRSSGPANRTHCNSTKQPVANFRTGMSFAYRGDGSEPAEYRLGRQMHSLIRVNRYDPSSPSRAQREYLTDVERIGRVRIVRRTDQQISSAA